MAIGLIGQKLGMSRLFQEDGNSVPVTVVQISNNKVVQVKTEETDGYTAVQVSNGKKKLKKVDKATKGHYLKAEVEPGTSLDEFRLDPKELADIKAGFELKVSDFKVGELVDVIANSRGKGYAGVIKRYNFKSQRQTHGVSLAHRAPGSIGQCQTPGRVWKGKKMAGRMGNVRRTVQNLKIVKIDEEKQLVFVAGGIPGAPSGKVMIKPAIKASKKENTAA